MDFKIFARNFNYLNIVSLKIHVLELFIFSYVFCKIFLRTKFGMVLQGLGGLFKKDSKSSQ